jgi:hypothetical protein
MFSSAIYDSPFDSVGTYGATVADLNNDGYVVMWGNEMGYSPFNKYKRGWVGGLPFPTGGTVG